MVAEAKREVTLPGLQAVCRAMMGDEHLTLSPRLKCSVLISATSISQAVAILLPQPPEQLPSQAPATTPGKFLYF
ncbi:hypothetical protein AAY473_031669 [Plecturocebus cupreus]